MGAWDQKACCKARVTSSSGMGPDLPADLLRAGHVLKGASVGPVAVGQRQVRDSADPHPIRLGRLGLVEEPVGGAGRGSNRW